MSYHAVLGQVAQQAPILSDVVASACPDCSYLMEGQCHWCENGDTRPGCTGCVDRKRPGPAWYQDTTVLVPLLVGVGTTVLGTIASYFVLRELRKAK